MCLDSSFICLSVCYFHCSVFGPWTKIILRWNFLVHSSGMWLSPNHVRITDVPFRYCTWVFREGGGVQNQGDDICFLFAKTTTSRAGKFRSLRNEAIDVRSVPVQYSTVTLQGKQHSSFKNKIMVESIRATTLPRCLLRSKQATLIAGTVSHRRWYYLWNQRQAEVMLLPFPLSQIIQ